MARSWNYFWFLVWFAYLIVASVLLFTRGFLLSKSVQHTNSTCIGIDSNSLVNFQDFINNASTTCLPQKARVVLIIIDALRYDFAVFNNTLEKPNYYQNKLPVIQRLLKENPDNSRLYKFMADPPTTTMQRIKAITTGSLPTFVDVGSNFATNEINEDNIIDQLIRFNLNTILIGDDTWDGLYPNRFLRKYPFPSFDVWDLDSVDNGVNNHLANELTQKDWDFLIAHYLGVDHCGHRYGPSHPEMERKLTEMNAVIENVVNTLDQDTVLFVIGDHGMTETGNHGGDAEDEITAAFFIYSKQRLLSTIHQTDTLRQISIVPIISAIFGIPIPFSNLGALIFNALPYHSFSSIPQWHFLLVHIWGNVQQVLNYIENYAKSSSDTFSKNDLIEIRRRYNILKNQIVKIVDQDSFDTFANDCLDYLKFLRETCEDVWIQFDGILITRGLIFLALLIAFVFIIVDGIPSKRLMEIFQSTFVLCLYCVLVLMFVISVLLFHLNYVSNFLSTVFFLTGLVSLFLPVILIVQNWSAISLNWYESTKKDLFQRFFNRIILLIYLCGLFSNSYVVEESWVLLFLITTLILFVMVGQSKFDKKQRKSGVRWKQYLIFAVILILLRLTIYFWRCRERLEQPWCYDPNTLNSFTLKTEPTKLQWFITLIILALFVTITKGWLRSCGNLSGFSVTILLLNYLPTVLVVCINGYGGFSRLPYDSKYQSTKLWQINLLPWIVYISTILATIITIWRPLCVYRLPSNNVSSENSVIPYLFRKIKTLFNRGGGEDVPILCGLGTSYSAAYVGISVYWTLVFALVLGTATAPSSIVMFMVAALVLIVTSIRRLESANSVDQLTEVPNTSILLWMFLSQYFFYATGHQPSFPNIIWDAAFVGTSGMVTNNLISGFLVIINTFCSHILFGFLFSLQLIVPYTISAMLPSLLQKNILEDGSQKAEVVLYENREMLLTTAFVSSCKYVIYNAIRVFVTMLSATIHCRHMMIWKIFAPKLIFESMGVFISLIVVILSFLVLIRITCKVDHLVFSLNKKPI